ncbi:MAG: hypothetical protein IJH94_02935 [Clostridia bacterium]|nr:hypothetical protein [Clostridia bacterium]
MSRGVTKAQGNRYCQARLKAAKYNADFAIRRTAAEHLPGVEEDSLKKYELDITRPPNVVVALMADAYGAPELREWYCANECPLGSDRREITDEPPERTMLRICQAVKNAQPALEALAEMMSDGVMTPEEAEIMPEIEERLQTLKHTITEVTAAMERAKRTGVWE